MNYFGKFDATVSNALGQHPGAHVFSETVHASHAPSDAIVVPDAQLLFGGEFKRTGVDLVLSGDGREYVLHDYFKGEKHAPLASPDGAHLTGDLVNALAGQVQYAQAGGNAAAGQVIGHVTKLAGTATAIRNGVSIILNNGDNVEKGDVVASGSDSTVGITFIDGTVFGLSSNARMVLNEMVYDPNGSNNSSLLSLVAGTITFVAGETAKHGDMKVDTPVATMGIRGTAVLVEIDFSVPGATPDAKFQVLVEPDGTTGSYILFDKTTLTPLAVVDRAGMQINVSNGVMSQTLAPLSPEIQKLITDVFSLKFSDSTNTKSIEHFTDSIVPNVFGAVNFALVNGNLSTFAALPPPPAGSGPAAPSAATIGHIAQAPNFFGEQTGKITEAPHVTGITAPDTATGQFQYFDINTSDHDTVSVKFSSFTYQNAKGQDVSGSLNSLQLADIAKVEAAITVSENTGPNTIGNGTANWSYSVADKAFDFLAAGETLTLTYTATVDNNYQPLDQTGTQTITITITGTNDAPMITSPQQNVSFVSAGTDTKGGELIPNTATHGTLNFADPDLTDTHTVAVKMASALLDGQPLSATVGQTVINELAAAVTASIAKGDDSTGTGTGTIDWTLANLQVYLADLVPAGELLVLTYAVTVTDSQGATSTQDVVVTIGGNNEAAVVWTNTTPIPEGGVALWSTASNWEGDRAPSTLGTDDVIIGTDQVLPGTPVFPATVNDAEAAKSLTMDYFTDFGSSIPELDILSTGTLTIGGALNTDTSTDSGSPLTAESIIKNFGTLSVGGIATLLKHSVLDNDGTITLAEGGVFGDQSSVTNSGTIEVVSDTLDVQVGIANAGGILQVDGSATLKLSDGAVITKGEVTLGSLSALDVEKGAVSLPAGTPDATLDGVSVIGTSGSTPSTIEIGATAAAILLLDDGTIIENGNLTISGGSALDITTSGAMLDGVNVTGANATLSVAASTIEVGTTTTTGTVLTLDDGTTITNGNLIVDSGNTLDIESSQGATLDGVNVTNSGTIQVAPPATLTLEGGTINGGTIDDTGTLSVIASSKIENATVEGTGDLTVTGGTLTLSEVTLDGVTLAGSFTNADTLTIDDTVTLNGATISGGTIDDTGTLSVSASSKIENATVEGTGDLTVTSGTLTLSEVTLDGVTLAGSFTNADTLTIDDTVTLNGVTINGGAIDDTGTLSVIASSKIENATVKGTGDLTVTGGTLTLSEVTLDGVTLAGSFTNADTLTIDDTVTLNGATLNGGTIDDTGTLSVIASSKIENATVEGTGDLTVTSGTLTLSEVTLDGVTLAGSFTNADTLTIDDTVTLNGATLNGGTIDDTGTLSVIASSKIENATVEGTGDLTVTGGTLTLSEVTLDGVTLAGSFTNADTLTVDHTVTLNGATLNGGTIDDTGTLSVIASSKIENATVEGTGDLTVTGGTLTLSEVTLDGVTLAGSFTNADTLTIDDTVTLNGATISGGTIDDTGTLSVIASSKIENATVEGTGDLTVTGGTLTLSEVTLDGVTLAGSFTNADTLTVDHTVTLNGATLNGGTIDDTGTLSVIASSKIENATVEGTGDLTVTGGTLTLSEVTLDGVTLAGSFTNADTLTIDDTVTLNGATISGGTIDDTGTLSVSASSKIENATVEGTGDLTVTSGTLTLSEVTLDGVTLAGSFTNADTLTIDDTVTLNGVTINGGAIDDTGTLSVIASSKIENATVKGTGDLTVTGGTLTLSEVTLDGVTLAGSFTNADTLTIDDTVTLNGATLNGGTIDDTGTLSVIASSKIENATVIGDITVDSGKTLTLNTVVLDGVTLSGGTDAATAVTVSADSTIESATVAGDVTVGSGKTLTLNTVVLDGVTLSGGTDKVTAVTIGADSTIQNATVSNGVVTVNSGVTLTLDTVTLNGTSFADTTTGGTILVGSSTTLTFNGATIDGGTLNIQGVLDSTGSSTISGATIINQNLINIVSGTLTIDPTPMTNTGTIEVHSGAGLVLDDDAVTNSGSSGDGTIQVDQNATLTLEDSSITGGVLKNFGTIDLTGDSSFSGLSSFVNEGTLEAEGTLTLTGMTINNAGHILKSSGSGVIDLVNTTINGGTLGGKIETVSPNKSSTLNGLTLAFGTLVTAVFGILELTGTIFNNGEMDATTGALDLDNATVDGGTFGGHGTIATASGNSDSILSGVTIASGSTMTAAVGTLDLTGITTNNGEIDATTGTLHLHNADVTGGTLGGTGSTISTDSLNVFSFLKNVTVSAVTKVSASAGTLELTGTINNHGEIDATTGTIELINATIDGGTLGGDGTIVTASALNTLDGVTIASGTTVEVADGTVLDLVGTITDHGAIALEASGDFTGLEISGNVSLTGGGGVTMNSDFYSFIASDGSAAQLSNFDTISGAGTIGDSHLTLSNSGTIDATGSHALVIDTGVNSFTSAGLVGNLLVTNNVGGVLEASAGHTLQIDDNVLNNGLIESGSPGGVHSAAAYVDITGNITNSSGITGSIEIFNNSTVEIGGSVSSGQTVTFGAPGGPVATNGLLVLDDSHDFHGTISGLVENNNESLENQVDLKDLTYIPGLEHLSVHASGSNGPGEKVTVTVSDFFGHPVDFVTLNLSGGSSGSFEVSSDGHGGVLLSDPPTSGNVAVDSNQTLEISAASSATVNFTNSSGNTGELVLDDSKDFSGAIDGFTGDGTTANSDLIDVTDVNIADVAMNKTTYADHGNGTGTLTLYNAGGQALDSINFDGNYQLANFTIENDGDGGTLIVDPPVNTNGQTPGSTTVASNENSTGTAGTDGFVFNFAGHNHPPTVDYHSEVETLQPGGSMLTNLHTGSNGAPDQGHSNMPLGGDGQDHVGLSAFAKAHLHAADFHFV